MREENITFKEVLSQGVEIYRNNFGLLFKFAFISICITLSGQVIKTLAQLSNQPALIGVAGLISSGISLISIYFLGRLIIGLNLSIANIYHNKEVDFTSMYKEGADKFWTYFGVSLLSGLIYIVPVIIVIIGSVTIFIGSNRLGYTGTVSVSSGFTAVTLIGCGLILLGVVGIIIIFYKLCLIKPLVILNSKEKNHIGKSFSLTKGNHKLLLPAVLLASLVFGVIFGSQMVVSTWFVLSPALILGLSIVNSLIQAIFQPLISTMFVIIFFNLEEDEHDYTIIDIEEEQLVLD